MVLNSLRFLPKKNSCIYYAQPFLMNNHRVEIHLLYFRVRHHDVRHRLQQLDQRSFVIGGASPDAVEDRCGLGVRNHPFGLVPGEGQQTKRDVVENFHHYSAQPIDDDRTQLFVYVWLPQTNLSNTVN